MVRGGRFGAPLHALLTATDPPPPTVLLPVRADQGRHRVHHQGRLVRAQGGEAWSPTPHPHSQPILPPPHTHTHHAAARPPRPPTFKTCSPSRSRGWRAGRTRRAARACPSPPPPTPSCTPPRLPPSPTSTLTVRAASSCLPPSRAPFQPPPTPTPPTPTPPTPHTPHLPQITIMSRSCAERVGLLRLIDRRFQSMMVGVGSAPSLGERAVGGRAGGWVRVGGWVGGWAGGCEPKRRRGVWAWGACPPGDTPRPPSSAPPTPYSPPPPHTHTIPTPHHTRTPPRAHPHGASQGGGPSLSHLSASDGEGHHRVSVW